MSALLRVKKDIFKTIFALILASKKVFWKNRAFLSLSSILKLARTILNIWRVELSILWAPILVWWVLRPSFHIYADVMVLILSPESIKTLTSLVFFQQQSRLWIYHSLSSGIASSLVSLLASIINTKDAKTEISFWKIPYSFWHSGPSSNNYCTWPK